MILTLVGVSQGMLDDQARRTRGVGADVIIRAPDSSAIALTNGFKAKFIDFVGKQPHVALATGALVVPTGPLTSITGLDVDAFVRMSGPFRFLSGGAIVGDRDVIVDEYYARQHALHIGDTIRILNVPWRVSGIFEQGRLARIVVRLGVLQDLTDNSGKISVIYAKLDDSARTQEVIDWLKAKGMKDYKIWSLEELISQFAVNNVPMLKEFIYVVVGGGVIVGFWVVFLSMYMAVLERTREIGVLKALGASPGFILNLLLRESALLSVVGSAIGILMTYGTRWLIGVLMPSALVESIVPLWWPIAAAISLLGSLLGAAYPGLKAARQDAIEALSYD